MKETVKRNLHPMEYLRNIAYNARYSFLGLFEEYSKNAVKPKDKIYILGNEFVVTSDNLTQVQD
jgi:hypothetical protein